MKNLNFRLTDIEFQEFSNYCEKKGISKEEAISFLIHEAVTNDIIPNDVSNSISKADFLRILRESMNELNVVINSVKYKGGPLITIGNNYVAHFTYRKKGVESSVLRVDGEYVLKVEEYATIYNLIPLVILYGQLDSDMNILATINPREIPVAAPKNKEHSVYRSEINDTVFFRVKTDCDLKRIEDITRQNIPSTWYELINSKLNYIVSAREKFYTLFDLAIKQAEKREPGEFYLRDLIDTPPTLIGRWFLRAVSEKKVKDVEYIGRDDNNYAKYKKLDTDGKK